MRILFIVVNALACLFCALAALAGGNIATRLMWGAACLLWFVNLLFNIKKDF